MSQEHPLLLFDGVCNLCNGTVQFVIDRDPDAKFRFASLQSPIGQTVLKENQMNTEELDTVILIKEGKIYTHSDAPLLIVKELGGFWTVLYVFKIIPKFIRDGIYRWVAANRYRWFGKQESCWLPTEELKSRFL